MDKLTRLSPEDRDNLTAYLDGELDDDGTRHIEAVLINSTVARNDVEALSRTYDLLDLLPRPHASKDFTERTVATAKLETYQKPLSEQAWFKTAKKTAVLVLWGAALVLSATAGYAVSQQLVSSPDDVLLDEFPVINNLDTYRDVDSIEFVHRLQGEALLESIQNRQEQ